MAISTKQELRNETVWDLGGRWSGAVGSELSKLSDNDHRSHGNRQESDIDRRLEEGLSRFM
ncbi:hypothetical protein SQ11_12920 [Nitrosospira sp. NpAV]|nr:hypothetical protein SQ11_12920 [Nitrosospira sp. NpAV]